jgi:hypothetical protein
MGHSRPDTTQQYTDDAELDELADALERAASTRGAQASPDLTTLETEITAAREELEWRRRESNQRNVPADRDVAVLPTGSYHVRDEASAVSRPGLVVSA